MGVLDDPATCSGIANEWEPCSPALFESMDTLMYQLITDPQYLLPQNAPNGNYCPVIPTDMEEPLISNMEVFPNPSDGIITVSWKGTPLVGEVKILNSLGQVVGKKGMTRLNSQMQLDLRHLSPGLYFLQLGNDKHQKILIQ
jgi:hypothetical protein